MEIPFAHCRRCAAEMARAKGIPILSGLVHLIIIFNNKLGKFLNEFNYNLSMAGGWDTAASQDTVF